LNDAKKAPGKTGGFFVGKAPRSALHRAVFKGEVHPGNAGHVHVAAGLDAQP
jgi:hypothetical protein